MKYIWNNRKDLLMNSEQILCEKCGADPCVYIKSVKRKNGKTDFVIIVLYVDDTIWFSNNTKMVEKEKLALAKRFKVEDLEELH